mgnify:CR=1 FL=1
MKVVVLLLLSGTYSVFIRAAKSSSVYNDVKYFGCFQDKAGDNETDRALNGFSTSSPNMTVDQCLSLCINQGEYCTSDQVAYFHED